MLPSTRRLDRPPRPPGAAARASLKAFGLFQGRGHLLPVEIGGGGVRAAIWEGLVLGRRPHLSPGGSS